MDGKNIIRIGAFIAGLGSVVAGLIVGKRMEKKYEKQLEEEKKFGEELRDYSARLGEATEKFKTEVEQFTPVVEELSKFETGK